MHEMTISIIDVSFVQETTVDNLERAHREYQMRVRYVRGENIRFGSADGSWV